MVVAVMRTPLHPLLVHFPIAFLAMSFVFDVLSLRLGAAMVEAARYNIIAGLGAAVVAGAAGIYDYFARLPAHSPARRVGRWHAVLNGIACLAFGASLFLRWHALGASVTPRGPFVLSALGVVLLGVAGYLGGVVVVNYGVDLDAHGLTRRGSAGDD
jgi:uncharacterized membrane protein